MIYSLTGKITMIDENTLLVDTGSVGYEVICSTYTAFSMSQIPEKQTILTYLQVREDAMCLYGFKDKKEKLMFSELMLVSGIGPKMAITILSGLPISEIIRAITSSDVKTLSSIKGLGKKTAERIVLELNNKLGGVDGIDSILSNDAPKVQVNKHSKEVDEATEVLVSMGMFKQQAIEIAKNNFVSGMTSEELVVKCLKNLK